MYDREGRSAICTPSLSGHYFDGMGAMAKAQQRRAIAQQKQAQRKAAKKAVKVAGRTVMTSNPAAAEKVHAAVVAAQQQLAQVTSLASRARQTRSRVDIQKALTAAQSAGKFISSLHSGGTPSAAVTRMRGLGYMGTCISDPNNPGVGVDDQTQQPCSVDANSTGTTPTYPGTTPSYPGVTTGYPGATTGYGTSTGLVPGFGLPQGISTFGQSYAPLRACSTGSNLPRCIIYQMAVDEQNQFQYVFSILQQMYAQLLQIVQQLMAQLQSAQQQPGASAYGQNPYDPYGQNPYAQGGYGGGYGQPPQGYGGQYQGPGGYGGGVPYSSGGSSSIIPPGFDTGGGDMSQGIPGDASQVFPGPAQGGGYGGQPVMNTGGAQTQLISSDSLPVGADQQATGTQDDAAGIVPMAQSGPNIAPAAAPVSFSVNAPQPSQPQIIVLQQGPGQNPYADAGLPAGDRQNQPGLDPQEHDGSGLTGASRWPY